MVARAGHRLRVVKRLYPWYGIMGYAEMKGAEDGGKPGLHALSRGVSV